MFDSGIAAADLITGLKDEIDVAQAIPNTEYVFWLNSLQQLLYSEFIKEQRKVTIISPTAGVISIDDEVLDPSEGESRLRFEDIYRV